MEKVYYTFDLNRRVYPKRTSTGYVSGGPIYSEHFQAYPVINEDDKEIICEGTFRINKRTMKGYYTHSPRHKYSMWTPAERDANIWIHSHHHRVRRLFDNCRDIDIIKQVAELLGYDEAA